MKRITKTVFCAILAVTLVLSFAPFAFATTDLVFNVDSSKPSVGNGCGYIELLSYNSTYDAYYVTVFSWTIKKTAVTNNVPYCSVDANLNFANDNLSLVFSGGPDPFDLVISRYSQNMWQRYYCLSFSSATNYTVSVPTVSGEDIVSYHIYGDLNEIVVDEQFPKNFVVNYSSDGLVQDNFQAILQSLTSLVSNGVLTHEQLDTLINSVNDILERNIVQSGYLNSIDLAIEHIKSFLDEQVVEINAELDRLLAQTTVNTEKLTELSNKVSVMIDICSYIRDYSEQIASYTWSIHDAVWDIDTILWDIYFQLHSQGESNLTKPNTSNMDGYLNAENSLLDNSNIDVSNVVQVDINQNALTVVWSLVQQVFDSNSKVFGVVLTVISLGIVAMVLGRKV